MPNPLYTIEQLPADAAALIREFDDRYLAALATSDVPEWTGLGALLPVNSPMQTFPVGQLALKYQRTQGEPRFKSLLNKSFDLKVEEFDEGVEEDLMALTTQPWKYKQWQAAPGELLGAEGRLRNSSIITLLEAGATTVSVIDGEFFFDTDHPANLVDASQGTWSNYQSVAADPTDLTKIAAEVTAMRGVKDGNGQKMGVDPDTILVPVEKFEYVKNKLAQSMILEGAATAPTDNYYKGRFNVIALPEATDANDWYLVDSKMLSRLPPWLMLRYQAPAPLGYRSYDESSDFFKDTGRIKVSSHVWYGFSLGFPHAIRLIKGA